MVWVIGCEGMLGSEIIKHLSAAGIDYIGTDVEVDISNYQALYDAHEAFTSRDEVEWIINCAACTDVNGSEINQEKAIKVNTLGAINVADLAGYIGAKLIHFSTDYVYADSDDNIPRTEDTLVAPTSVYGMTKAMGDRGVLSTNNSQCYIFRIAGLYGHGGGNFVETMMALSDTYDNIRVVSDQYMSPTNACGLAENIIKLIQDDPELYDVYNYSDDGIITWNTFAKLIFELGGCVLVGVDDTKLSDGDWLAIRPRFSAMDTSKVQSCLGFNVQPWTVMLAKYMEERGSVNEL